MSNPNNTNLLGKRYRMLLRVSTLLNDASTDDQRRAIERFAKSLGLVHVGGDEVLEGVSGSKTFNRRDLTRLLDSARRKKDYDILIVYDSSRLTRGGAVHGLSLREAFRRAKVLIMSVMDPVPPGDFEAVMHTLIDTQNNLYSKKLSAYVSRGMVSAYLRGEVTAHGGSPVGLDRQYLRFDKTPFLRLRYIGNGDRELWSEETGKLIRTFRAGVDTGTAYRKQKGEIVRFVPGDPKAVAAIRDAFTRRYKDGWGYGRIGLELTLKGIKPFRGTHWGDCVIRNVLLNPTYLGWNYFLKSSAGLHHMCGKDGPIPVTVDQDQLEAEKRMSIPHTPRKREDMFRIEWPELREFIIDPVVRDKATSVIEQHFAEYHVKKTKQPPLREKYNPYPATSYMLRGIMREPTYGKGFIGRTTGQPHPRRYYALTRSHTFAVPRSVGRRTIPAEPVETAVLSIVREALSKSNRVEQLVRKHVAAILAAKPADIDRDAMEEELKEIKARQRGIFTTASAKMLEEMKGTLGELRLREQEIERQLSLRPIQSLEMDAAEVAKTVLDALPQTGGEMSAEVCQALRPVLASIIRDFQMDLATREGHLEVALPEELLLGTNFKDMCQTYREIHPATGQAQKPRSIRIGVFRLIPASQALQKSDPRTPNSWAPYSWVEIPNRPDTGPADPTSPVAA